MSLEKDVTEIRKIKETDLFKPATPEELAHRTKEGMDVLKLRYYVLTAYLDTSSFADFREFDTLESALTYLASVARKEGLNLRGKSIHIGLGNRSDDFYPSEDVP